MCNPIRVMGPFLLAYFILFFLAFFFFFFFVFLILFLFLRRFVRLLLTHRVPSQAPRSKYQVLPFPKCTVQASPCRDYVFKFLYQSKIGVPSSKSHGLYPDVPRSEAYAYQVAPKSSEFLFPITKGLQFLPRRTFSRVQRFTWFHAQTFQSMSKLRGYKFPPKFKFKVRATRVQAPCARVPNPVPMLLHIPIEGMMHHIPIQGALAMPCVPS